MGQMGFQSPGRGSASFSGCYKNERVLHALIASEAKQE